MAEGGRIETPAPTREVIWAYLVVSPGKTAYEISRCALDRLGPFGHVQSGSTLRLLRQMEADGQITCEQVTRPGQGQPVSVWRAVPGVFAIEGDPS